VTSRCQGLFRPLPPSREKPWERGCPRAGRLKYFLQNWELLTSDQWTLNTVTGYKLELTGVPRQSRLPSPHPLNASQLALVEDEIASLLDERAIQQVPRHCNLFYSNLFLGRRRGEGNAQ